MTETGEEEEVLGLSLSDPPSGASIFLEFRILGPIAMRLYLVSV